MRILVVEDDRASLRLVERVLVAQHHAVDTAVDGPTADELFAVNSYDLVVLDWTIPAPNGHELLRRWRAGGSETPVLLLTGHQTVADRVNGLDSGADDYLTKPFAIDELLARVHRSCAVCPGRWWPRRLGISPSILLARRSRWEVSPLPSRRRNTRSWST